MAETMRTHDLMDEITVLDPKTVRLYLDEFEELYLQVEGSEPAGPLRPRRAFPVRASGDFISLEDKEENEVGLIRRLADLDHESRAVLEAELERTYFTTLITRVEAIDVQYHVPHWQVETDRGTRDFELRSSRRDVRVLGMRVLLRDADGNRYEIPDLQRLDQASRHIVDQHI
ncbi:DUF1854 domain-containing protein [Candidatus Latescibacterota bacterium]